MGKLSNKNCEIIYSKNEMAFKIIDSALENVKTIKKPNLIWLELNGCSGNAISLLNGDYPDLSYMLKNLVSLKYSNSLMANEGERAFEEFMETLETDFILAVDGAVSTSENGMYNVIANYKNRPITGKEALELASWKAKYILALGTCASHGGMSKSYPNPSNCLSVDEFLKRDDIIKIPGCPAHPEWIMGTIAHLISFGKIKLDEKNRPLIFYSVTIHERCNRRSYFDKSIFASNPGEETCMFKLGCKGPITKTDCPMRQWNSSINWPIENNSPCIGCAQEGFPDFLE